MRFILATIAVLGLPASAFAKEEGWLATSIITMVEHQDAAGLDGLFQAFHLEDRSGLEISSAELLENLAACRLDYAQDRVFLNAAEEPEGMKTGSLLGYVCGPSRLATGEVSECQNDGFSLVSPASNDGERQLLLRQRQFWATERCGSQRPPAISIRERN